MRRSSRPISRARSKRGRGRAASRRSRLRSSYHRVVDAPGVLEARRAGRRGRRVGGRVLEHEDLVGAGEVGQEVGRPSRVSSPGWRRERSGLAEVRSPSRWPSLGHDRLGPGRQAPQATLQSASSGGGPVPPPDRGTPAAGRRYGRAAARRGPAGGVVVGVAVVAPRARRPGSAEPSPMLSSTRWSRTACPRARRGRPSGSAEQRRAPAPRRQRRRPRGVPPRAVGPRPGRSGVCVVERGWLRLPRGWRRRPAPRSPRGVRGRDQATGPQRLVVGVGGDAPPGSSRCPSRCVGSRRPGIAAIRAWAGCSRQAAAGVPARDRGGSSPAHCPVSSTSAAQGGLVALGVVLAHVETQVGHPAGVLGLVGERAGTQPVRGPGQHHGLDGVGHDLADPGGQQHAGMEPGGSARRRRRSAASDSSTARAAVSAASTAPRCI